MSNGTIAAAIITAAGTIAAAMIAAGLGTDRTPVGSAPPAAAPPPTAVPTVPFPAPEPSVRGVQTTVINTGGVGVWKWDQPTNTSGRHYGPGEGEVVEVLCQRRDGQMISETDVSPGQPAQWPVWNRLKDGKWIPDLYTDLPKEPGPVPPEGLTTC